MSFWGYDTSNTNNYEPYFTSSWAHPPTCLPVLLLGGRFTQMLPPLAKWKSASACLGTPFRHVGGKQSGGGCTMCLTTLCPRFWQCLQRGTEKEPINYTPRNDLVAAGELSCDSHHVQQGSLWDSYSWAWKNAKAFRKRFVHSFNTANRAREVSGLMASKVHQHTYCERKQPREHLQKTSGGQPDAEQIFAEQLLDSDLEGPRSLARLGLASLEFRLLQPWRLSWTPEVSGSGPLWEFGGGLGVSVRFQRLGFRLGI